MRTTRQKLKEHLDRIESQQLRDFVRECLAITSQKQTGAQIPRKKYRELIALRATDETDVPEAVYLRLSPEELSERAAQQHSEKEVAESSSEPVRLLRLELENFGSFCGKHSVELAPGADRRTIVFVGRNGSGKSTTFHAINWALFSDEYLKDLAELTSKSRRDLINEHAIEAARQSGGSVHTSVTLWFSANGLKYRITRKLDAKIINDQVSESTPYAVLHRIEDSGNFTELVENEEMSSILRDIPRTAREFYLFDGERVNQFTADDARRRIHDAIKKIIGMDVISEALEELRVVQGDIKTELRRKNTDSTYQQVAEKLDQIESRKAELTELIDAAERESSTLQQVIDKLEQHLRDTPDTQKLQASRDEVEANLQANEGRRTRALDDIQAVLAKAYSCLAAPAIKDLAADLQKLQSTGHVHGGVNAGFLQELLGAETCVCGRPLGHDAGARQHMTQLLEAIQQQDRSSDALIELRYSLPQYLSTVSEYPEALTKSVKAYAEAWEERGKLRDQLTAISEELGSSGPSNHVAWESERAEAARKKMNTDMNLGGLKNELKSVEESRLQVEKELTSLAAKDKQTLTLSKELDWTDAAVNVIEEINNEFATIARMEATHRTVKLWNQLLPNVSHYNVEITEEFEMLATTQSGASGMAHLSMGQRQCLGLAFITAIAQVAGTKPPIVIDMPFGKLDGNVAVQLAASLPTLADQLILMLLPQTEWNSETQRVLMPNVKRVINIVQDADKVSAYDVEGDL